MVLRATRRASVLRRAAISSGTSSTIPFWRIAGSIRNATEVGVRANTRAGERRVKRVSGAGRSGPCPSGRPARSPARSGSSISPAPGSRVACRSARCQLGLRRRGPACARGKASAARRGSLRRPPELSRRSQRAAKRPGSRKRRRRSHEVRCKNCVMWIEPVPGPPRCRFRNARTLTLCIGPAPGRKTPTVRRLGRRGSGKEVQSCAASARLKERPA